MDRSQLEIYNENIRHGRWASKLYDKDDPFKKVCLTLRRAGAVQLIDDA